MQDPSAVKATQWIPSINNSLGVELGSPWSRDVSCLLMSKVPSFDLQGPDRQALCKTGQPNTQWCNSWSVWFPPNWTTLATSLSCQFTCARAAMMQVWHDSRNLRPHNSFQFTAAPWRSSYRMQQDALGMKFQLWRMSCLLLPAYESEPLGSFGVHTGLVGELPYQADVSVFWSWQVLRI